MCVIALDFSRHDESSKRATHKRQGNIGRENLRRLAIHKQRPTTKKATASQPSSRQQKLRRDPQHLERRRLKGSRDGSGLIGEVGQAPREDFRVL